MVVKLSKQKGQEVAIGRAGPAFVANASRWVMLDFGFGISDIGLQL